MAFHGSEKLAAHPHTPSARWKVFMAQVQEHAVRAVGEREDRLREVKDKTVYHRTAEQTPPGG
jgi:hypothetical protein